MVIFNSKDTYWLINRASAHSERQTLLSSPVSGSSGRSDSLLLEEREDLTGTGKKPRRKRAMPITSSSRINEAKTDERTFILLVDGTIYGTSEVGSLASNEGTLLTVLPCRQNKP